MYRGRDSCITGSEILEVKIEGIFTAGNRLLRTREQEMDKTASGLSVCITEDGRYITIGVLLPGVTEEQVQIDLERTTCIITIRMNGKKYQEIIRIPTGARMVRKKFSEGALELILEKPAG